MMMSGPLLASLLARLSMLIALAGVALGVGQEAEWRPAEVEVDERWHTVRKSMPCRILAPAVLAAEELAAPTLIRGLNWTDPPLWRRASVLASFGRAPARAGNQTALRGSPFETLERTTLEMIFSADRENEDSSVFDDRFVEEKEPRDILRSWIWLDEALDGVINFQPQLIFLSALPRGHWRGVGVHQHGPSASALAVGRKLWVLAPPDSAAMDFQIARESQGHGVPLVWEWARGGAVPKGFGKHAAPSVCAQDEGEVMVLPEFFYHGTVPVGDALGVAMVQYGRDEDPKEEL